MKRLLRKGVAPRVEKAISRRGELPLKPENPVKIDEKQVFLLAGQTKNWGG
jgi:hypothetical protein